MIRSGRSWTSAVIRCRPAAAGGGGAGPAARSSAFKTSWTRSSVVARRAGRVPARGPAPTRSCRCRSICSRPRSASRLRSPSTRRSPVTPARAPAPPRAPTRAPVTPATAAARCRAVQRTFLGQVMTARPCPACGGFGSIIPHPCPNCAGDGRVRTRRTLTVKIPAGVEDQMRIRLAGQGEVGPGGGPAGDLYVEIHENPHDVFSRKGDDLHCRVTVPMAAAALGTRLTIKTLDSDEVVDVRRGHAAGFDHAAQGPRRATPAWHRAWRPVRAPRRPHARRSSTPIRKR